MRIRSRRFSGVLSLIVLTISFFIFLAPGPGGGSAYSASTGSSPSGSPSFGSSSGTSLTWYQLGPFTSGESVKLVPIRQSAQEFSARIVVPGILTGTTSSKQGLRGIVEISGGDLASIVGHPRIPVLRYMIELTPGAKVTAELQPAEIKTLSLRTLGIEHPLLPVQQPVPKIEGAYNDMPFVEDAEVYSRDAYYPDKHVALVGEALVRGRHIALIEIRPVLYNPVTEKIEIWSEGVLSVTWSGGSHAAAVMEKTRLRSSALDSWIKGMIKNAYPSTLGALSGSNEPTNVDGSAMPAESATLGSGGGAAQGAEGLFIVVHDNFYDAIQPLVEWKKKSGYKVEVAKTSSLGNPPTDVNVKNTIQTRYDTWSNPSLGFVLLVGDTDFCPIHTGTGGGKSQVTDNWYACTSGTDYLPDLAVSRISTRTAAETTDVIDKLVLYEKAAFAADTWAKKAGFIGTGDMGYYNMIEGTHDYCIDTYMTPNGYLQTSWSHGKESCDRHYYSYSASTADISASINDGRSIVNYSGHGSTTAWSGPTSYGGYNQDNVRANTNDQMYPFVISNACVTGSLAVTECFAETWQKVAHRGAIAFWGASNNSYWYEDDYLQRSLYTNIYPMDSTPAIGIIINQTKVDLYNYYGNTGTVAYYFDMYNLLSEPTLSIWTRQPQTMTVSYPESVPIGQSTFDVTVTYQGSAVANALVAVRKTDDGVFESAYTDTQGKVTFTLDPTPMQPGAMDVTVTKHDFRPFEGIAQIISPDGPWLIHRSHQADDSAGDNDGKASPNETIIIPVTVENIGQLPGTALSGTLSTNTASLIQIVDGAATFPNIAPALLGTTNPDHFKIWVKTTASDGALLGFDLNWTAAGGSSGTTSFSEYAIAPDFAFDSYSIDDASGNGGGTASPDETVNMTITVSNIGHKEAKFVHGALSSNSPYVTILQDEADFPDIPVNQKGSSRSPQFQFHIADNAPDKQPITFYLSITENGSFHSEVLTFNVMISACGIEESVNVPMNITDSSMIESLLYYPDAVTIGEANVHVDIKHTYKGQLRVILISPAGTNVLLHNYTGGSADNIITWYDTETSPAESLSKLNGENSQGTWRLRVEDSAAYETGTLDGWMLEVCGQPAGLAPMLSVTGHTMEDSGTCDPDGYADIGETVTFHVTIQNSGSVRASGVQASIYGQKLEGINNPQALPDLDPGVSAEADFRVLIGAVGCMQTMTFNISVSANEGVWGSSFTELLETDEAASNWDENIENGGTEPAGWTHQALQGPDDWRVVSTKNHTTSGAYSWFASNYNKTKDDVLISPSYSLLVGGSSSLEFYHWVDLQNAYDGAVLEISADGGSSWSDLGSYITEGGYDRTIISGGPLSGRQAWTGEYTDWKKTTVNLTNWAGRTVKIRFRIGCDNVRKQTGWWVDDIRVTTSGRACDAHACGIPGEVTGVMVKKSGNDIIVSWDQNVLAQSYKVYRAADPASAGNYTDVTSEDPDPGDAYFLERSNSNAAYFIITAIGPDGEGSWGHYSQ